jgi:hypothetical protein
MSGARELHRSSFITQAAACHLGMVVRRFFDQHGRDSVCGSAEVIAFLIGST